MKISANKNRVTITEREIISTGAFNAHWCEVSLSEDFDDLQNKVVFKTADTTIECNLVDGGCYVPMLTKVGRVEVGVYGYDGNQLIISPQMAVMTVNNGSYAENGEEPIVPDVPTYQQILESISPAIHLTASQIVEVLEGSYKVNLTEEQKQVFNKSNTLVVYTGDIFPEGEEVIYFAIDGQLLNRTFHNITASALVDVWELQMFSEDVMWMHRAGQIAYIGDVDSGDLLKFDEDRIEKAIPNVDYVKPNVLAEVGFNVKNLDVGEYTINASGYFRCSAVRVIWTLPGAKLNVYRKDNAYSYDYQGYTDNGFKFLVGVCNSDGTEISFHSLLN